LTEKECTVTVDAFGYSENAMALRVESVTCDNGDGHSVAVPSFANHNQLHVTMALKDGVKPVDSVITLLPSSVDADGNVGTVVPFTEKLVLKGKLKKIFVLIFNVI